MALLLPSSLPFPLGSPSYMPSSSSGYLIFPKRSLKISCNVISTPTPPQSPKQSRQLRHDAMKQFLLNDCGLSHAELPTVKRKEPQLFRVKSIDTARRAVEFFKDSGFTPDQVRKTILKCPSIIRFSVDKSLSHKFSFLVNIFGSKAMVSKTLEKLPTLVTFEVETLENKLKNLESIGLHNHQIREVLEKDPRFLSASVDKVQRNMDFLIHTAGLGPSIVVKYPRFLNMSVKKRLLPRYKVFEYLIATRSSEYLTVSLVTMFCFSEQSFQEKFLIGNPDVAEVYEKYKSVDLELT